MPTNKLSVKEARLEIHSAIASLDKLLTWAKLSPQTRADLTLQANQLEKQLQHNVDFKPTE